MTTQKINGVYCVSNALGGGMKNVSRPRAETQSMNGEVSVFELNKPQPYEVFSSWPDDIQKEYLKKLYWTHGGTLQRIGGLFGFSNMWAKDKFDSLGIPTMSKAEANRDGRDRAKRWEAFLRGGTLIKDLIPEETKEELEKMTSGSCISEVYPEEKQVLLESLAEEPCVLFPAPKEEVVPSTGINLVQISTISNAMYHLAHISDESLKSALGEQLANWIYANNGEHLKADLETIRKRLLRKDDA